MTRPSGTKKAADLSDKLVPAEAREVEIRVVNSRFVASIAPATSVDAARSFIQEVKQRFPDANHHVPAFIIGHGQSITEHCSDDGEPSGTAGRPALAVLRGSGLGDAVVVVTRFFGGTKLGTGGLVRAYSDAVRACLDGLPLARKTSTDTVMAELPYSLFERVRSLVADHEGRMLEETFGVQVTVTARFESARTAGFIAALRELSQGTVEAFVIESDPEALFPL